MRYLLIIFCLLLSVSVVNAQRKISGNVIASDSHKPLAAANVFLANTSFATTTGETGVFVLAGIPHEKYELIVSLIGYETYRKTIEPGKAPLTLAIELKPKVDELQEVTVTTYDKYGWDRWGNVFIDNFMGTSSFAEETSLLNRDVLRFYYNDKTQELIVRAKEPLRIQNNALGYILHYDLELFEYDLEKSTFLFRGYPFFEEMRTERASVKRRWQENRMEAYRGSLMHFVRSVISKRLQPEGFEVRQKVMLTEYEKKRVQDVQELIKRVKKEKGTRDTAMDMSVYENADTLYYFKVVNETKAGAMLILAPILPADSVASPIDSISAILTFKGSLDVLFPSRKFPPEYARPASEMGSVQPSDRRFKQLYSANAAAFGLRGKPVFSGILVNPGDEVVIFKNGSMENRGYGLVCSNYWAWWKKMSNKLPYDYTPPVSTKGL